MANELRTSVTELRDKAYRCRKYSDILEATLASIDQTVSSINTVWTGESSSLYINTIRNKEGDVKNLIAILRELSNVLNEQCDAYDLAEALASGEIV